MSVRFLCTRKKEAGETVSDIKGTVSDLMSGSFSGRKEGLNPGPGWLHGLVF